MTIEEMFRWGKNKLERADVPEAEWSAWYLMQACLGQNDSSDMPAFSRSDYFLRKTETVSDEQRQTYSEYIERRKQREPLEYIIGYTEFMGLPFFVNESVLVPRQDTETVVEEVYPLCEGRRVLDMCTGSGCIGLSIGVFGKPSQLTLCDISEKAMCVTRKNADRLRKRQSDWLHTEILFVCGDLFEKIEETYDVIVANPPYIETDVVSGLMPEVREFEPVLALDGGPDGMCFYRRLCAEAPQYLCAGGMLCMEIGYNQGERVSDLMKKHGFENVRIRKDLAGNDRVVLGNKVERQ